MEINGRTILLDAESFSDVLEYIGEFVYDRDRNGPAVAHIGDNEISGFCTVDLSQVGGPHHRSIRVRPLAAVLDAVRGRIVTDDDRLSFRIIAHGSTGRALVILEHGHIIGSHWLAYIDPATIPAPSAAGVNQ